MNHHTAESLIEFETRIRDKWERGELPCLLHLCGGNEAQLIDIFREVNEGDWVFSTHRNHYHALLAGVPAEKLEGLIQFGQSMFVFDKARNFLSSSILAGTCCVAAGVAFDIKQRGGSEHVWCFLGDGAEEEGHFYEAVLFVNAHALPCTFVIEDNDRSVDTPTAERRPNGSGVRWPECVMRYEYVPSYPHAGSGCKHRIEFKR